MGLKNRSHFPGYVHLRLGTTICPRPEFYCFSWENSCPWIRGFENNFPTVPQLCLPQVWVGAGRDDDPGCLCVAPLRGHVEQGLVLQVDIFLSTYRVTKQLGQNLPMTWFESCVLVLGPYTKTQIQINVNRRFRPSYSVTLYNDSRIFWLLWAWQKCDNICRHFNCWNNYRDGLKGMEILLSNRQAGPGRAFKQE